MTFIIPKWLMVSLINKIKNNNKELTVTIIIILALYANLLCVVCISCGHLLKQKL
jgi:hypothetical protein